MLKKFTLIEMLVVISIIGILITILMPSLSKARSSALSKVCLSNLKQQGLASYIYADDNEEIFLVSREKWWNQIFWENDYMPREERVMTCPSFQFNGDWFSENYVTYGGVVDTGGGNLREGYIKTDGFKGADSKKVESPDEFFLFTDSAKINADDELVQWVNIRWSNGSDAGGQRVHTRHNEAANVWFLDGHAQGHRKGSLKTLGFNSGWTEGNAQIAY